VSLGRYRNELIVLGALLFALGAWGYKAVQRSKMAESNQKMAKEIALFHETVSLKKIWGDKRIPQKLKSIRSLVPSSQVQWHQRGKKLKALFTDLKAAEVNTVITKLLNTPVQVEMLRVTKKGETYSMEIQCKW